MRISRLYLPQPLQTGASVDITGQGCHYLSRVLRLPVGAALVVFNGDGREFPAVITATGKQATTVSLSAPHSPDTESRLRTVLGLGVSRGERMDYAVQKSTELGVSAIVPLYTEHCEVRLKGERAGKRQEHWQQVAVSACEQSGRVCVPEVAAPMELRDWLDTNPAELKLVFDHTRNGSLPGTAPAGGVALLIGPEGGLSAKELEQAAAAGFTGIALGNRVLRTETAPVAALSVLQFLWG